MNDLNPVCVCCEISMSEAVLTQDPSGERWCGNCSDVCAVYRDADGARSEEWEVEP